MSSCVICNWESEWEAWAPPGKYPFLTLTTGKFGWGESSYLSVCDVTICRECAVDLEKLIQLHGELHATGCCLHILTDDGNCTDRDADFCVQWAREHGHSFCAVVAQAIRQLPEEERKRRWNNYEEEEE